MDRETLRFPDTFRARARSGNPQHRRLYMREIAEATGSSYEHIRKIFSAGEPVLSKDLNDKICTLLGLSADEMWHEIERHKMRRKYPHAAAELTGPPSAAARSAHSQQGARTWVVTYYRKVLVQADDMLDAAVKVRRSRPERIHVRSVRRVWLDAMGQPQIGDPGFFDETLAAE